MVTQLQIVSTVDLYYICQMVDGVTRRPGAYLRNIEDIFGDMPSASLARKFPRWTCFHIFVEELISSVIMEDAETQDKKPGDYWVDHLLISNGILNKSVNKLKFSQIDGYDYIEILQQEDLIGRLCEKISKQVFHVLFANRGTMSAFAHMVSGHVLHTSPSFAPEAFSRSGHLKRTNIPAWAKDAVFHRDKGRCVLCKADLTKRISLQTKQNFDHIVPLALGGMNCVTNLQLTCTSCNSEKGARSAHTSKEYEAWYDYNLPNCEE